MAHATTEIDVYPFIGADNGGASGRGHARGLPPEGGHMQCSPNAFQGYKYNWLEAGHKATHGNEPGTKQKHE